MTFEKEKLPLLEIKGGLEWLQDGVNFPIIISPSSSVTPPKNMLLEIMIVSQGDLDKLRDGVVFLTVHDVGASYEVESLLKIL